MKKIPVKIVAMLCATLICFGMFPTTSFAAYASWNEIVDDMQVVCDEAYELYLSGDAAAAREQINVAYFGYYEKLGFEKTVMAHLSGKRATQTEYQFSLIKRAMREGEANVEVRAALDTLVRYLREDANELDGDRQKGGTGTAFFASLLIILRDGFEAILIVGAIVAYLVKSGNRQNISAVYRGVFAALVASILLALTLSVLSNFISAGQELIEGVTLLIAVAVLFYVSNWMVSKSQAEAWSNYIEGKVQGSIAKSSLFSLAFAAFLAVFREGAEVILFYMALFANTKDHITAVWFGLVVGCAALVVIYILIRTLSIKLPIKAFFLGTSILLSAMAISFIGSGVKRLQLSSIVSVTPIENVPTIDLLGIFPSLETLISQAALLVVTIVTYVMQALKMKRTKSGFIDDKRSRR
jgi:high-affinity iron transporter